MSFIYAITGIYNAIRTEFNLRFHLVIANLICIFAYFYGLERTGWAALVVTIFTVITAELINTAVERAVDTATTEISPTAKLAKDASAGAVLMSAIGAVLVGVCLFGDTRWIYDALYRIFSDAKVLIPCLLVGIADLVFLFFGGRKKGDKK